MLQAVHIFGTSSSGIGALGVDGQAFIIQLITFVLVILVLKKWAVKPILKLLNERRDVIEKGVELGQKMQQEKDELEEKIASALRDARTQADTIIASARDEGRQVVQEAEDEARTKAEALVNAAADRTRQDTDRAWKNVEKELASLVSEATEAIIDEKVDAKKDAALIDKALKSRRVT